MTPRKHAELIKAWADGADVEVFDESQDCWVPFRLSERLDFRIKPVPKADLVKRGIIDFHGKDTCYSDIPAILTIDGETGEAKKVEIVK